METDQTQHYSASVREALSRACASLPVQLDAETLKRTCQKLLNLNAAQQALLVRNSSLAGRLQVCRRLVEIAEECRIGDRRKMLQAANAAVVVAVALGDAKTEALIHDARTEAWACLANALRLQGDFLGAEQAWIQVQTSFKYASGDPLLHGKLLELEGTLRSEQHRFEEGKLLFQRAQQLYEAIGEHHLAGRTLLSQGHWAHRAGDLDLAISAAYEGGKRIDCAVDPVLRFKALFNLVIYLGEAGQPREALELLRLLKPVCHQLPYGQAYARRLRWSEGRLQAALGLLDDAVRQLNGVRRELLRDDERYDAALASLDLAAVYAELGQSLSVAELAREMYPVFASSGIPREASATLLLFGQAAGEHTLTATAIRSTVATLRKQQPH